MLCFPNANAQVTIWSFDWRRKDDGGDSKCLNNSLTNPRPQQGQTIRGSQAATAALSCRIVVRVQETLKTCVEDATSYEYLRTKVVKVAEIVNGAYGADTVRANYVKFWFRRFRSGIFDVEDTPRTDRPVVENVDKITEIIEVDRHVSSRTILRSLKKEERSTIKQF
ncbi:histone-lysine N-methyltransferase SETMAR [Trichonephila clavipes]|nr:histone-lysine N-methyltransferase SETMAR [Trichonephila clavipes]